MPQVPITPGRQVQDAPLQGGFQATPDAGSGTRALAGGLDRVADVADKFVQRDDMDVAWATDAKIKTDAAVFTSKLQQNMRGGAVKGTVDPDTGEATGSYSQQVAAWWAAASAKYATGLSATQRGIITRNLSQAQAAATHAALQHENGERDKAWAESAQASIDSTVQLALQTGTSVAAAGAAQSIREQVSQIAQHKGIVDKDGQLDANWINQATMSQTTKLHSNMIAQFQQQDPAAAMRYFNDNKGEIDGARHDEITRSLNNAQSAVDGLRVAHDAFSASMPAGATPAQGTTPLDVVAMRASVEKQFSGNPVALSAANASLDRMVSDWKLAESQYQTGYKATLERGVAGGKSLAWAIQQPEWARLDGTTQAAISDHLQNRDYTSQLRAAAASARSDAADARADRALDRAERAEMRGDRLKGFNADPQFLALQMDPAALAKMQPQEITNLLLTMSQQQVESLRRQKATLNNAAAVQSASLTAEQFDAMAPDFGLKQHLDPMASKEDKQRYSVTKEAVDEALQQAQTAAKAPLSQEARMKLARDAVANTVVLNPGWFSSNKPAQVGTILPSEVGKVVVPDGDRGQIIAKARAEKNDPKYNPTAEEIGRAYLARRRQAKGQ